MYCDLCLHYDNPQNIDIAKYQDICELLTSAISDEYSILTLNIIRSGTVPNSDIISTDISTNLPLIYQKYSIKFLNSMNPILIDWTQIKLLSRITVEVSDSKDLYQFSFPNNALKSYDILAVSPKNEKIFELCLGDVNVDVITLNLEEKVNYMSKKHLITSAIDKGMFFEIQYSNFISDGSKRSLFIANVLLFMEITKGRNTIISSGAWSFFAHRSPFDIITIFETVFELKTDDAKKMLCENMEKVILKSVQRKYFKTVIEVVANTNTNTNTEFQVESIGGGVSSSQMMIIETGIEK